MKHILEYLILLLPMLWEVPSDLYRIKVQKKEDNHKADILPRIVLTAIAGLLLIPFGHPFYAGMLYSGAIFICFFDLIMGLFLKGNPFYKGTTSKTDKIISSNFGLYAEIFIRLWILGVGWSFYYRLDWIL